mmetsp:Transcript_28081/g.27773  ORF Transcript_28081/g.27773 Transcript_28081/m.27773 type:complete len:100 (+) Transcript_28081:302-601(+)
MPLSSIGILPIAKYLDIILYSYEQVQKENSAMGKADLNSNYEWGVVSIKPQDIDHELPMTPITMMRNSLPLEFGGSGVKLNNDAYMESVEFWQHNALIK